MSKKTNSFCTYFENLKSFTVHSSVIWAQTYRKIRPILYYIGWAIVAPSSDGSKIVNKYVSFRLNFILRLATDIYFFVPVIKNKKPSSE